MKPYYLALSLSKQNRLMKQILILVATLFISAAVSAQRPMPTAEVGTLDGKKVNLQEYTTNGKIKVISFWATWCGPCKIELDAMKGHFSEWKDKYDIDFIAISVDDARNIARIKPLVAQKGWPFTVLLDSNQELMRTLNIYSIPQTFLVDQKGNIVHQYNGYVPGSEKDLGDRISKLAMK